MANKKPPKRVAKKSPKRVAKKSTKRVAKKATKSVTKKRKKPAKALTKKAKKPTKPQREADSAKTVAEPEFIEAEVIESELVDPDIIDAEFVETSTAMAVRAEAGLESRFDVQRGTLLESFMDGKDPKTVKAYNLDLGQFVSWALTGESDKNEGIDPTPEQMSEVIEEFVRSPGGHANAAVNGFKNHLIGRGLAPNSINRKLAAVRSVVALGRIVGICSYSIEVSPVSVELVRDVSGCGPEGYKELLQTAESTIKSARADLRRLARTGSDGQRRKAHQRLSAAVRDYALLRLYHDAGLRRAEPLGIDYPKDVDLGPSPRVRFRGKKRKAKAWHAINTKSVVAIKAWVTARGDHAGPLFTSTDPAHSGKALNVRTVNKLIGKLATKAGVEVTPHGIRHTAATTLLDKTNGNVRAVAEFLRHKGLSIVQDYDDKRRELGRQMTNLLDEDEDESE